MRHPVPFCRRGLAYACTLAGLLGLAALLPAGWAAAKSPDARAAQASRGSAATAAVARMATAHGLVRYGDARRDALALITAARMLKAARAQPSEARRQGPAATDRKPAGDRYAVDGVLARAHTLAAGRPELLALTDDVANEGARGAASGPKRWTELVRSGETDRYRVGFRGGEPAMVAVSGDGDSDLDLYILDERGNVVCKDEQRSDDMACRWTPQRSGEYTIAVRNLGIANQYVAIHN
jgi:hypothetical protein